jgi:hypothetical protein
LELLGLAQDVYYQTEITILTEGMLQHFPLLKLNIFESQDFTILPLEIQSHLCYDMIECDCK